MSFQQTTAETNNSAMRNTRQSDFDATYGGAFAPDKIDRINGSENVVAGKDTNSRGHSGDTSKQTAFGGNALGGRKAFDSDNLGTNGSRTAGRENAAAAANGTSGRGNPSDGFASEQTAITDSGADSFGATQTYNASGNSSPFESRSTPHHKDVHSSTGATYGSSGAHPFESDDGSNTDVSEKLVYIHDTAKIGKWSSAKIDDAGPNGHHSGSDAHGTPRKTENSSAGERLAQQTENLVSSKPSGVGSSPHTGPDIHSTNGNMIGADSPDTSKTGAHGYQDPPPRYALIHREDNFSASRDNDRAISRNNCVQATVQSINGAGTNGVDTNDAASGPVGHDHHQANKKIGAARGSVGHDEHHHKASFADKMIGGAEKFAGKMTGNAGLVEKGQQRKTSHGV